MYQTRMRLTGAAFAALAAAAAWFWRDTSLAWTALPLILIAGALFTGRIRVVKWVEASVTFLLTGVVLAPLAWLAPRPLDLTWTEARLDPIWFAWAAGLLLGLAGMLTWARWMLTRPAFQEGLWPARFPARMAAGIVIPLAVMRFLALHGQSASAAAALAQDQLGTGFNYQLTAISSTKDDHGTWVSGEVTAWNSNEIKTLILRWRTK